MRLIDADALRERFLERAKRAENDCMPMTAAEMMLVARDIDRAPTVEQPEPVEPKTDGTSIYDVDGFIVCGKCGGSLGMPEVFKFCPWCGKAVKWNV